MAKRAQAYPQVSLAAADLVNAAVTRAPAPVAIGAALQLARKRDAVVVAVEARYVLREDLVRASRLGLEDLASTAVARDLPSVEAGAGEVTVRRLLAEGAPLVVVRDRRGPLGGVATPPAATPEVPTAPRLARRLPADTRALLASIGRCAAARGAHAFLVGGMVRDLWRDREGTSADLDVVVEGDGPAVARDLARELGGAVREHRRFLTASVEAPRVGRIDVATARSERYESRGTLPRVMPAGIDADLRRRDFTINAMAIELDSDLFGLLDPLGGRADLARRRLRVLHPLSYVEDPTRLFRAARYATRFGFAPDAATARAQALALRLVPYAALSGARIVAELERILVEPRADQTLARLGRSGAFRLLDPRYRFTAVTSRFVAELPGALAWARQRRLGVEPVELGALALTGDQSPRIASAALERLAFAGERLNHLRQALGEGRARLARLSAASVPSARARLLRELHPVVLAWLWLVGDGAARAALDWYLGLDRALVALSGDEVIALGVPRGPAVAGVLAGLRDGRLDGRITDRATEIDQVRHWLTKGG
ncbi:MAG: CCA tRNA nucleotidyltransferase [Deltaproteobacteria bacterium]|nr:MAG: CCA tRNA nucleotidyltransferase [Deltaproteobacteria bacterium]